MTDGALDAAALASGAGDWIEVRNPASGAQIARVRGGLGQRIVGPDAGGHHDQVGRNLHAVLETHRADPALAADAAEADDPGMTGDGIPLPHQARAGGESRWACSRGTRCGP